MKKLLGSEKQVKWASDIRAKIFLDLEELETCVDTYRFNKEKVNKQLKVARDKFEAITEAKYYLENYKNYDGEENIFNVSRRLVSHLIDMNYEKKYGASRR